MKVICVDNKLAESLVTINRYYEVLSDASWPEHYRVMCDNGSCTYLCKDRFVVAPTKDAPDHDRIRRELNKVRETMGYVKLGSANREDDFRKSLGYLLAIIETRVL